MTKPKPIDMTGTDAAARLSARLGFTPKHFRAYGRIQLLDEDFPKFFCERSFYREEGTRQFRHTTAEQIDKEVEAKVKAHCGVLVTGAGNAYSQRAAIVPMRYSTPRILVFACGLRKALGEDLDQQPFAAARLWRDRFYAEGDLAISMAPDDSGFLAYSPRVEKWVRAICGQDVRR